MSNKIQKTIEINAKVKASLEGMEKTVGELERGLEKQKFDLSKNSGLSKLIKDYKAARAELDELMSGDVIARTDIKKAEQLGGKVSKLYKQIGKSFEDLRAGSDDTFRKLFPDSFTAKISKGTKAIENFFSKLDSKTVKEGRLDEVRKDLTRLSDELDGLKNRRLKIEVDIDKKGVKDELDRINKDLEQMRENFKKKLIPEEKRDSQGRTQTERLNSSVSTWSNKLAQDTDARKNLKVQSLSKSQSSQISKLEGQLVDAQGANLADIEKKRLDALHAEQTKRATIAKTPGARDTSRNRREYGGVTDKELAAQIAASEKELQRLRAIADKIDDIKQQPQRAYDAAVKKLETQIKTDRTNLEKAERALEAHTTQRENQEAVASQKADDFMAGKQVAEATQAEIDALKALNDEKQKNLDLEKKLKEEKSFDSQKTKDSAIAKKDSSIEKKKLEIQELENTIKNLANDTNFDAIFKKLKELGVNTEGIDKTRAGLEGIKKDLESLDENTLKEIREALNQMGVDAKDTDTKVDTLTQGVEQLGDTDKDLKRAENEMENLKNQVLQFFSVTNAIQLFKRTVQSAINTVKELDAVMTETAVVTDFSVGDMWEKLPEYASHANDLGASIKDVYAATTLYYQQGLQTNEAMGVGVETMKMARIANLEAGDATQYMTAALRGFNMEVNELNAQRVNDVYSELAAITAADTSQIATAMSKTASIASAANMEFETTAALLAQIIETTQEAPETAGTALKTIIARFSEVKKLREEGQMTGEDEEGEVIDVNKIQGALRTVGISMDDFFAGTEGLDSVLLKLAEKWKDLDFTTQRYIATTAAGSRQQSRFIAMMSDYERTMELATAANNSAGASQQQFDKTLESMEAKLQKLKNAWDEFAMGLANNEILKFGVDLLTGVLEAVNKLTEALSGGNGLIKSFVNLIAVIGALKGGSMLFDKLLGEGKIGIDFGNGQKGSINLFSGAKEKALKEGQEAGKSFNIGLQRAIQKSKEQGIGKGIGSLFGEIVEELDFNNKIDYLANAYEKNQENLNFDIGEVSQAFNRGGVEAANQAILDMGGNIDDLIPKIQTFKIDFQGIGTAAIGVGTAINLLGGLFEKLEMTEVAEAMQKIGTSITGIGTAIMALGPLFNTLGITVSSAGIKIGAAGAAATLGWLPFIAILGAIAAAVAVVGIVAAQVWNNSLNGRIKSAEEATEKLNSVTEETKNRYEELENTLSELDSSYETISNLTYGTKEWKEEVSKTNDALLELAETYDGLSDFIELGEDGVLRINYSIENDKGEKASDILGDREQIQRTQRLANLGQEAYSTRITTEKETNQVMTGTIWGDAGGTDEGKEAFNLIAEAMARGELQLVGMEEQIIDKMTEFLASLNPEEYGNNITDKNIARTISETIAGQYMSELKQQRDVIKTGDTSLQMMSIISEAIQGTNLTIEQKQQVGSVYDTERMDKLFNTELDRLESLDTQAFASEAGEYVKQIYGATAEILNNGNVQYEDAEGNIQTVKRNDYEAQVAAIKAQEKASGHLEVTAKFLSMVSKDYQKTTKGLLNNELTKNDLSSMELQDVNSSDLEEIEGKVYSYLEKLNLDWVAMGFGSIKEAAQYYSNQATEAIKADEMAYDKYENIGGGTQSAEAFIQALENISPVIDLTTQQTKSLVDSLAEIVLQGGSVTDLTNYLSTILKDVDPDNLEQAFNLIANTNWEDAADIESTLNSLEGLGAEIDDTLVRQIIKATNAIKSFDLDKFNKKLENAEALRDKVEGNIKDNEATYSKEDVDKFVELGIDTSEFFKTGFDEYTYTGKQEILLTSIDTKVGNILGEMTGDINEAVTRGQGLDTLFNKDDVWGNENWQLTELEMVQGIIAGGVEIAEGKATQEKNITTEAAQGILQEMYDAAGIAPETDVSLMGADSIKEAMEFLMQYLYDLPQNLQIQGQNNQENLQQQYYEKSGSELLNIIDTSTDAEQIDLATQALAAQAAQAGVTANEIEYYKKQLKESGKESEHLEEAAMELATRIKTQQTKINEASTAIGEYLEIMDDAAIGSETYISALSGIPEQIEKAFGYEPSMDWVKDNLDLIKEWAAGSEEAGIKIWDSLYNNLVAAMQGSADEVASASSYILDWLYKISGTNVWAGVDLNADGFFVTSTAVKEDADALAKKLSELGFEVVYEPVTKSITLPSFGPKFEDDGTGRMVKTGYNSQEVITAYNIKWKKTGDTNPFGGFDAPSSYTPKSGGGGGGGGGSSEPTKWENPYDEFYNTVEKLNEELRTREKLERRYQKLLDNTNTKASDLVKNAREQLDSLQLELKTRQELLAGRERQMADIEREYNDLSSYASYNEEKQVIEIDWTKIEALDGSTNEELTSRIEEYIGKLEEQQDLIEEEQDSIAEIEDAVKEIREQGKDEYFDLESQIKEALEKARQEEIDKLSEINDSINDTNSRLIDAMQSSIDKYRQDRDNERTEEELSDKQRRLAYLQQDTSGANALEILKLQEEIAQGQEDYTDTLIDQKISELQEQNDEAAEQRQQQIDLMQAQLDHYLDSELVWADIYSLMNSGIGPDGIIAGSALEKLLMEGASFEAMSYLEKMKWLEELENNVAKAVQWLMEGNSTEALMAIGDLNKGQKIEFTTADGEKVSGTLDEAGNVITDSGEKYEGVYRTYNGAFVTQENYIKPEPPKPVEPEPKPEPEQPAFTPPQLTDDIKRGVSAAIINGNYGWGVGGARSARLAEVFGTNDIQRNYVNRWITSGYSGSLSDYSYINMRKKFKQYKTGGLADFTGPAWLDGTKSKPEYILNAEQTKSFFQLVDVLGSLKSGATQSSQITGDSIYDVDINVESIGNDYDVEQLASTIKRMINDDARYRNNNAINLQR